MYRFRNAHCIKGLISIRIITLLISEAITVTMGALSDTIKASMHTCFAFSSLTGSNYWCATFQLYILANFNQ